MLGLGFRVRGIPKDSVVIVALYTRISLHQDEASHFVSALTNADPSSLGYLVIDSRNMDLEFNVDI